MSDAAEFQRYAQRVLKEVVPKIADSAYVMAVAPNGGEADVKMALEIGFAILLDKPLIVIAPKGRTVADRLLRIADHVVEADVTSEAGRRELHAKLAHIFEQ